MWLHALCQPLHDFLEGKLHIAVSARAMPAQVDEPGVWTELGHAQLDSGAVNEAISSYLRSGDSSRYKDVIARSQEANAHGDLVKYLLMVRKKVKESKVRCAGGVVAWRYLRAIICKSFPSPANGIHRLLFPNDRQLGCSWSNATSMDLRSQSLVKLARRSLASYHAYRAFVANAHPSRLHPKALCIWTQKLGASTPTYHRALVSARASGRPLRSLARPVRREALYH